jgi:anti-sigma factor RsiW
VVCERVREQVSLLLDGDLSELEGRMLESHVAQCRRCAEFRASVTSFTEALRAAPLEVLEAPIVVERRRVVNVSRVQVGVAAALALAALGLGAGLQSDPSTSASLEVGAITRFPSDTEITGESALLRLVRYGNPSNRSAAPL